MDWGGGSTCTSDGGWRCASPSCYLPPQVISKLPSFQQEPGGFAWWRINPPTVFWVKKKNLTHDLCSEIWVIRLITWSTIILPGCGCYIHIQGLMIEIITVDHMMPSQLAKVQPSPRGWGRGEGISRKETRNWDCESPPKSPQKNPEQPLPA